MGSKDSSWEDIIEVDEKDVDDDTEDDTTFVEITELWTMLLETVPLPIFSTVWDMLSLWWLEELSLISVLPTLLEDWNIRKSHSGSILSIY